jgi:hypothetical protein
MSVTAIVPRPPSVKAEIPDSLLIEAARAYMNGEKKEVVAQTLGMEVQAFNNVVKSAAWRMLCAPMGEELLLAKEQVNNRLESMLADHIQSLLEDGIKTTYEDKDGRLKTFWRALLPKELAQLGAVISDNRKWIEAAKAKDPHKPINDLGELAAKLKKFAKAKDIEGDAEVVGG